MDLRSAIVFIIVLRILENTVYMNEMMASLLGKMYSLSQDRFVLG